MTEPTEADVEAQAVEAEQLAATLEAAVLSGDTSITHEELTKQKSLAGFLRLQVAGARKRAEDAREDRRITALRAIRAEVAKTVPASGTGLVAALEDVEKAAEAFIAMADDYDVMLTGWRERLNALGVGDSQQEQGIGLNGISQIVLNGIALERVAGAHRLNGIFVGTNPPHGTLTPNRGGMRDATFEALHLLGEAGN